MKSVKSQLLSDIDKKAEKIRQKRVAAATLKTVESLAFDFFRQVDEAKEVARVENKGEWINFSIFNAALNNLDLQLQAHDKMAVVSPVWRTDENGISGGLLGVKITWSLSYAQKNSVEQELYIDITQMLLS